jgi:hypothetical protein
MTIDGGRARIRVSINFIATESLRVEDNTGAAGEMRLMTSQIRNDPICR